MIIKIILPVLLGVDYYSYQGAAVVGGPVGLDSLQALALAWLD